MDIIPGDWLVSSNNDENGICGFLASVISYQLNQRRVMACARNVAEMDLLNVEAQYVKSKKVLIISYFYLFKVLCQNYRRKKLCRLFEKNWRKDIHCLSKLNQSS
jgi:hypothetical protein